MEVELGASERKACSVPLSPTILDLKHGISGGRLCIPESPRFRLQHLQLKDPGELRTSQSAEPEGLIQHKVLSNVKKALNNFPSMVYSGSVQDLFRGTVD